MKQKEKEEEKSFKAQQIQLNKKVNDYSPPKTFKVCGSWFTKAGNKPHTVEFIMKNNCWRYRLVHEWVFTADSSVWEEVRSMPMFDERAFGGNKYTHLHRCKKIGNDRE